jgi:hypothetical protein
MDTIGRSGGIFFVLSVLSLVPFAAHAVEPEWACAELASVAEALIYRPLQPQQDLKTWLKLCNTAGNVCRATREILEKDKRPIGGLTCDPNSRAELVMPTPPSPDNRPFKPTPENACAMVAANITTEHSDGHTYEWLPYCNRANVDDCKATVEYIQNEIHKTVPGLTCHGP